MLSEILSAVLPYALRILTHFTCAFTAAEETECLKRRTWQHCSLRRGQKQHHDKGAKKERNDQPTIQTQSILPDVPSMSSRLSLLTNHSAAAFALRGSVKSIGSQTSSPGCSPIPSCSIRPIAYSAFSSLLAARYTFAPRLTRWSAMYRPIPELLIVKFVSNRATVTVASPKLSR